MHWCRQVASILYVRVWGPSSCVQSIRPYPSVIVGSATVLKYKVGTPGRGSPQALAMRHMYRPIPYYSLLFYHTGSAYGHTVVYCVVHVSYGYK
jgi:hypothetical protein